VRRIGKIARLPHKIRDELNSRLLDGHRGKDLVPWLNSLDETRRLIDFAFNGNPISEQNVSDWRKGGYQDWLRNRSTRERIGRFLDLSAQLQSPIHDPLIPERLFALPTAELASDTTQILAEPEAPLMAGMRAHDRRAFANNPHLGGRSTSRRCGTVEAPSNQFKPIQTYSNLFKPIQTYSNLFKPIQT
jgi:hypothetical protein